MSSIDTALLKDLERFVVANDDLQQLEERVGRFNIFNALRVANVEIRHSNFLAWLLDPSESHGQGDLFLKAVLMDMLAQTSPEDRPVSPVVLDGAELGSCDVRREWRSIDLLIVTENPPLAVVIENKVGSRESTGQLKRYERAVAEALPDVPRFLVFLTVDGDEASRPDWCSYTYADLHRVLDRCRRIHGDAIGGDVAVVLDHYLRLLGSRFMNDPEIDKLCQRIYKTHRQALDLIYERAGVGQSGLLRAVAEWVADSPDYVLLVSKPTQVKFAPVEWEGILTPIARQSSHPTLWIRYRVFVQKHRCRLLLQAVPTTDTEQRRKAIERVVQDQDEFGLRTSKKAITDQWTQLSSAVVLSWRDEEPAPEAVLEKLSPLLEKSLPRFTRAVRAAGEAIA